jgi:AraC family transcriptional regulator, regulatory protein of adaptative response / methylated-DNA-[protein]-cysteine methyltransferase
MAREPAGRRPTRREMERAYLGSDAAYDGVFVLGVRTTGIFCRPSCRARKPQPRNVEFFGSPREALAAGYRACKRCRPTEADGGPPAWVGRLLAHLRAAGTARVRDADLRALDIVPSRARRYFKQVYGMTFQAYQRAQRLGTVLGDLQHGADLTDAGLDSGYESTSGFRAAFARTFGQPPGRGRAVPCVWTQTVASPLGPLTIGATRDAVCLLEFAEPARTQREFGELARWFGGAVVPGDTPLLRTLHDELAAYFAGRLRTFSVPLACPGTPFQQAVWTELGRIPYGQTICYEELATRVGRPHAQRAVGLANSRNRIAIVIPCHRVVNKCGRLGGYGGGLWRKQHLLDLERRVLEPELFDTPR